MQRCEGTEVAASLNLGAAVIAVTGGTRGIGLATARLLACHGANVVIMGTDAEAASHVATSIADEFDVSTLGLCVDARIPSVIRGAYQDIFQWARRLDGLVNNAGVLQDALIGMVSDEALRETFDVNTLGAIHHLQGASRLMGRTGGGSVVNVTSIVGVEGNAGQVAYASSKAALIGLTKSAAKELAARGIRVNAVAPGFIDTDMSRSLPPDKFEERVASIRMGRMGTPDDVAKAVLFLMSDLSQYITGQIIGVDGGMAI